MKTATVFSEAASDRIYVALASLGTVARLLVALSPGNQVSSQLGGGGDTKAYVRLSQSLITGRGLSYFGQPSAFRPPSYPILLAALHLLVGDKYIIAIRIVQFLAGMATAWVCSLIAAEIAGCRAGKLCFVLTLLFPTLLYFTGEILTETLAGLLTAAFFYFLVRAKSGRTSDLFGMGIVSGLAALLRFNMVFLSAIAVWRVLATRRGVSRWTGLLTVTLLPLAVLSPWIVRNLVVFHGQVVYSTHTGMDLVEGLLRPEGRADAAQGLNIVAETGWSMQGLEINDPARLNYPAEPVLNHMAMQAAIRLWSNSGTKGAVIVVQKLGYFWLSTDQILDTRQLSFRVRLIRFAGVGVYWTCLAVAVFGLHRLRKIDLGLTTTLLLYFAIGTSLHLFFSMNTRLRVPLMDPVLCILISVAIAGVRTGTRQGTKRRVMCGSR